MNIKQNMNIEQLLLAVVNKQPILTSTTLSNGNASLSNVVTIAMTSTTSAEGALAITVISSSGLVASVGSNATTSTVSLIEDNSNNMIMAHTANVSNTTNTRKCVLSNSSSDGALDVDVMSDDDIPAEQLSSNVILMRSDTSLNHSSASWNYEDPNQNLLNGLSVSGSIDGEILGTEHISTLINHHHQNQNLTPSHHDLIGGGSNSNIFGTTTAILLNSSNSSSSMNSSINSTVAVNNANLREQQINQLYAQVQKEHKTAVATNHLKNIIGSPSIENNANPNDFHRGGMTTFGTINRDLNSSYDSILGSTDKLSESEHYSDNWIQSNCNRRTPISSGSGTGSIVIGPSIKMPSTSFTEQLSHVLTERDGRMMAGIGGSSCSSRNSNSNDDYTEIKKTQSAATINCKTLINEIRQAVYEAQPKVKQVMPQSLSPPGTVPWQQQQQQQQQQQRMTNNGPPSPTSESSDCSTPVYSPSKSIDRSGSGSNFTDRRTAASIYSFKSGPVHEWTKEQVGHWLIGVEMERYIPIFKEHNVEGGALLSLDSRDLKTLGIIGDDKSRFKRRLKELKANVEKERKDQERERREREKAIRKAEKKAAKTKK